LVLAYGMIAVEGLNIKGMIESGGFSQAITDAAWGGFLSVLRGKAEKAGVQFVEVDPKGTSQECSGCGQVVKKDLFVRQHDCPHCGLSLQRDVNAARNILARGQGRTGPAGLNGDAGSHAPKSHLPAQAVCAGEG
jgi:putative transposase